MEEIARAAYDRCHPDDSFEDLKHRAAFSKEDRMLLRDWLAAASAPLPQAEQNSTRGTKPDIQR